MGFVSSPNNLSQLLRQYWATSTATTTVTNYYTTFEVLALHLWRCVTEARGLPESQETKMHVFIDGRSRLIQPPLPPGYFGNVVFIAAAVASFGELLVHKYPTVAARKIREVLTRMDDEYLRSVIDDLEVEMKSNTSSLRCPDIGITSWGRMPIYDADFGWGKPVHVGLAAPPNEGSVFIVPYVDGGLLCAISMPEQQMSIFQKLLYHIPSVQ